MRLFKVILPDILALNYHERRRAYHVERTTYDVSFHAFIEHMRYHADA